MLSFCHRWAAAAAEARPTRLRIYRMRHDVDANDYTIKEMRWLQARQRQQRFQNIQEFFMKEEIAPDQEVKPYTTFAHNMVTYAGLWNLQKCELTGSFCLLSAVGTLPTTLQSLSLRAKAVGPPDEFALSAFLRFKKLESLTLAYMYWTEEGETLCEFSLDCVIDNLCTVDLSQNANPICTFGLNHVLRRYYNLGACFPNVTKFSARLLLIMKNLL